MEKNFLLGVEITNETKENILKYIITSLEKKGEKYYVVTPNPEILVHATKHPTFKSILNNARLALPDGIGVIIAGNFLGGPFKERVTGIDLMESLCKEVSKKPITVGFVGAGPKIAERAAECLVSRYPGLKVGFAAPEWHKAPQIDILFVAYGFPKQEEWMSERIGRVPVGVMISVGGSFDYLSGNVQRAPQVVRSIGFEWLYRLIRQPWRIKRQLALLEFIWLVLKEKML